MYKHILFFYLLGLAFWLDTSTLSAHPTDGDDPFDTEEVVKAFKKRLQKQAKSRNPGAVSAIFDFWGAYHQTEMFAADEKTTIESLCQELKVAGKRTFVYSPKPFLANSQTTQAEYEAALSTHLQDLYARVGQDIYIVVIASIEKVDANGKIAMSNQYAVVCPPGTSDCPKAQPEPGLSAGKNTIATLKAIQGNPQESANADVRIRGNRKLAILLQDGAVEQSFNAEWDYIKANTQEELERKLNTAYPDGNFPKEIYLRVRQNGTDPDPQFIERIYQWIKRLFSRKKKTTEVFPERVIVIDDRGGSWFNLDDLQIWLAGVGRSIKVNVSLGINDGDPPPLWVLLFTDVATPVGFVNAAHILYFEKDIYGEKANTAIDKIIAAISFLPIGNIYKVNKVMLSGLIKGEKKIFKVVGETVDWAENVDKEVIEKFSKVGEQSDAIIKNFWDEFGENQEKLQRLIDNPSLIDAWIAKNGASAVGKGVTSGQLGKIIGWGEGQTIEAVQQTINVTNNLTKSQVQAWAKLGLTKSWVQDQLGKYSSSLAKGGDKLKNTQLIHRKELMEKILSLWD